MSNSYTMNVPAESIQELKTILTDVKPVLKMNLDAAQYERDHETGGYVAYEVVKDRYELVEKFLAGQDQVYPSLAPVVKDLNDAASLVDDADKPAIEEKAEAIAANYAGNGFSKRSPHGGYPILPIKKEPSNIPSHRVV